MNFDKIINRKGTYSTQWDYISDRFGKNDILPFSISDTDFQIPEEVTKALLKRMEHPIFGYTRWNHEDYKSAISNHYKKRFQRKINKDGIVYSPSVMYSVSVLIRLLSNENDGIMVFDPMYDAFINVIKKNNRKLVTVNLDNESNYAIDFDDMENKLKDCRILLLCSPHNPTGKVFSSSELLNIVNICKKYSIYIISDEIHSDIILYDKKHYPIISYLENYRNIVLVNSSSKTFNTPSIGGSYAIIEDKQLCNEFLKQTREKDFVNSANVLGMLALMEAYENCDYYVDELNKYIEQNMDYTEKFLKDKLPMIRFIKPQATYLAWFDIRNLNCSFEKFQDILVNKAKVGIMSGETYGKNGAMHLRMNLGCPMCKLEDGLERLEKAVNILMGG